MAQEVAAERLAIRLLGPFDVQVGDKPLPALRTRKGEHLLALLALRQTREVQREWLATNLWPDSDLESAYRNLRRSLTDLRSALGPARDCLFAPTSHSLSLSGDSRVEVDVTQFDALVRKGDASSLEAAVDLYRGALLEGFEAEWIEAEREFRHQACLKALDRLASHASEHADWLNAVRWLKRITALEPFQEAGQRRLIDALAQHGDYAAATLVYREYRERLRREWNETPEAETTALFRHIQARRNDTAPRPSAIHKEPEAFTGSLPRRLTSFIGRTREQEEVQTLLGSSRLVTLLGPGGIGKTRLAIRVAEHALSEFPDGVWFVDLAPLTDPTLLLRTVARTLQLKEDFEQPLQKILMDFLSGKQLLLLLDNCEHLQEGCAEWAERLLSASPRLRLLATSRQPLGIEQEVIWHVPALTLPLKSKLPAPGEELVFVLPQYDAVRLFAERATEAMPAFNLTEQNASATLRIVSRLDGLPLAIELAAARVRALSVEQVAARLDNRFRLLTRGAVGAQPRQQTLRATIDWSYDLLTDAEAALLRRLSIFAGGWNLEAVEQVCGNAEVVLDLLTDLVEKSLVVVDLNAGGERRYRMLESIREYGLERLRDTGEEEEMRAHHASWFLSLAEAAKDHMYGPEQVLWHGRLEADHDNLRAVLEWGLGETKAERQQKGVLVAVSPIPETASGWASPLEVGMRMAAEIWEFWYRGANIEEARRWLEAAVEQSREEISPVIRGSVLMNAGNMAFAQNRMNEAKAFYSESLRLHRQLENRHMIAAALGNLAVIAQLQPDYPQARAYYEELLPLVRNADLKLQRAHTLHNYGAMLHDLGEYDRSLELHEESLALRREMGHRIGEALTLDGMAYIHMDLGNLDAAQSCFEGALQIRQEAGDRLGILYTIYLASDLEAAEGKWLTAVRLFSVAEQARKEIGVKEVVYPDSTTAARLNKAREMLGEEAFAAAMEAGSVLSPEEAIAECIRIRQIT